MISKKKVLLHNRFDIEVRNSRTGEVRQKAFAENIILDGAWSEILATGKDWFDKIAIGTGTGTIVASRTALFDPLDTKTATLPVYTSNIEDNFISLRQAAVLLEYEHIGEEISEVGIVSSGSILCTHALIKDMNGNLVVIEKTDTDIVTIYATVYLVPSTEWAQDGVLDICRVDPEDNAVARILLGRRLLVQASPTRYAEWDFIVGLSRGDATMRYSLYPYNSAVSTASLDVANKKVTYYARIPAADANIGGIRSAQIFGCSSLASDVLASRRYGLITRFRTTSLTADPVVEQIGEGDGETTDYATTFPFIPSDTVIKVDGTPVSPTIISQRPNFGAMKFFLRMIDDEDTPETPYQWGDYYTPEEFTFENPLYSSVGLSTITGRRFWLSASDDLETWTTAVKETTSGTGMVTKDIPVELQNKRYWKIAAGATYSWYVNEITSTPHEALKNILFASPPAVGSVITAEYAPECAIKDILHVLDIEIILQLGEYTP